MPAPSDRESAPKVRAAAAGVTSSDAETVTFALPPDALAGAAERYEILAELGRGGMGIVYKAKDLETGDIVALKILRPDLAGDARLMERFRNELRLARQITHRNACRTYELLRFGSTYVISMEYVEGESLRRVIDRISGVRVSKAIQITRDICAALREAHSAGIVHRDLKPENVMLDLAGSAKVMDFGIARSAGSVQQSVGVTGTPAYMAPEQAQGQAVDHRADIYAIGLILYELVTGASAFTGDTPVEVALKQVRDMPLPPGDLEPGIPAHVERTILKCLEKSPDKRFQSVDELEQALLQKSSPKQRTTQLEMPAVAVQLPARLTRWHRSEWALLAAGIVGAVVFLALFGRAFPNITRNEVPFAREDASQRANDLARRFAPDTRFGETKARFVGAWWSDDPDRRWPVWAVHLNMGPRQSGHIEFDNTGHVQSLDLHLTYQGSVPVPAEEVENDAAKYAAELWGVDVSKLKRVGYRFDRPLGRWVADGYKAYAASSGTPVAWDLPRTGTWHNVIVVFMDRGKLLGGLIDTAADGYGAPPPAGRRILVQLGYYSVIVSLFVALVVVGLFFAKRLYARTDVPVLVLSTLIAAGAAEMLAVEMVGDGNVGSPLVPAILGFVIALVLGYMLLSVCHYYTRQAVPVAARTVAELFSLPPSQAAGFSLLRGISIASVYLALHALALVLFARWGVTPSNGSMFASMFYESPHNYMMPTAVWPMAFVFAPAILSAMFFVALPAAFAFRASQRRSTAIIAVAAIWVFSTGAALLGGTTTSLAPTLALSLLQGVLFAACLLSFDLLTCIAAMFTIETAFVGYAVHRMFLNDAWVHSMGVVYWLLLVAAAAVIAARPAIARFFRRVQAITQ